MHNWYYSLIALFVTDVLSRLGGMHHPNLHHAAGAGQLPSTWCGVFHTWARDMSPGLHMQPKQQSLQSRRSRHHWCTGSQLNHFLLARRWQQCRSPGGRHATAHEATDTYHPDAAMVLHSPGSRLCRTKKDAIVHAPKHKPDTSTCAEHLAPSLQASSAGPGWGGGRRVRGFGAGARDLA